jgi:NAD(P)-dependent dehydrogenase (short-subunit alcohol dehydrogenase family)
MASVAGKVIAITGAASGIALQTSKLLASRGALLSLADINGEQLQKVAKSLQEEGAKVIFTVVNVADRAQVRAFIEKTVQEYGKLDGAANLAGVIGRHGVTLDLRDETDDEWDLIFNINAKGVFICMQEELKVVKSGASIVNAASVLALVGQKKNSIYTASKHAVAGLIRTAAKEEGINNIRINGIAPGFIDTPMVTAVEHANKVDKADLSAQALERKGRPEEIASIVAFLLSDESTFVTGAIWSADGGWAC